MDRELLKRIKRLRIGDYVQVDWHDAYKGEIRIDQQSDKPRAQFEVPVTSWGVYVGTVGRKKYVVLMRDRFNLNELTGIDDVDHNGIPLGMIDEITVLGHVTLPKTFALRLEHWLAKARVRKRKGRLIIPGEKENLN